MFSTLTRGVQTIPERTRARGPCHTGLMQRRVAHRLRQVGNVVNLSTPLGLAVAAAGRARFRRGPRGLVLAERYRPRFPRAGAFTIGNVVVTGRTVEELESSAPGTTDHEDAHAWQYLATLGLPFLPLYGVACLWSWLRTGDWASRNVFERQAGLPAGGYHEHPADWTGWRSIRSRIGRRS